MNDTINISDLTDNKAVASAVSALLFKIAHPINAIIYTTNARNPGSYFQKELNTDALYAGACGKWQAYAEGRVLVGNGTINEKEDISFIAGDTGGTTKVSLRVSEMPSHSHKASGTTEKTTTFDGSPDAKNLYGGFAIDTANYFAKNTPTLSGNVICKVVNEMRDRYTVKNSDAKYEAGFMEIDAKHGHTLSLDTNAAGSGEAHDNLQPYQVVYIWQRVE